MKKRGLIKRLNWEAFILIMLISFAGAAGNKSITNAKDWAILGFGGGLFFGLPIAWITKSEK